jgi:hypothetical protein
LFAVNFLRKSSKEESMNRKQFLVYIDHFNNKRFSEAAKYFNPAVTVEYPDNFSGPNIVPHTLHGPKEFIANYEALTANVREVLEVGAFISRGSQFFVELYTEFHAFRDARSNTGRQWKKGDISIMTNWVLYDLDEKGKFQRIRIAHFRNADPKTARFKHLVPKA